MSYLAEITRRENQRYRPARGGIGGWAGTVQMPPTRGGDPPSLTAVYDTFVTLL